MKKVIAQYQVPKAPVASKPRSAEWAVPDADNKRKAPELGEAAEVEDVNSKSADADQSSSSTDSESSDESGAPWAEEDLDICEADDLDLVPPRTEATEAEVQDDLENFLRNSMC